MGEALETADVMADGSLLEGLNDGQRAAVLHDGGPGLVLAGAGSGKTETMVRRVARLLSEGAYPDSILLTTFTNRAAREMRERLAGWVGEDAAGGVVAGTIHSIVWREIINAPMGGLDYRIERGLEAVSIIDEQESHRRVVEAIKTVKDGDAAMGKAWEDAQLTPGKLMQVMTVRRAAGIDADGHDEWAVRNGELRARVEAAVWKAYESLLSLYGEIDFDGVLMHGRAILDADPAFLAECHQRWRHVLVDEFQDINPIQWQILHKLAEDRFFAVGDERQSIYRFRGADVGVLLNVRESYPNIRLLEMAGNYRSAPEVLKAANVCATHMQERLGREDLFALGERDAALPVRAPTAVLVDDEEDEADWLVATVQRDLRNGEQDIAVLYRKRASRQAVERALMLADVPHRIVGDVASRLRVEAKDTVGLLGFLHREWDTSATKRLLRATSFGLSESALDAALKKGQGVMDFLVERAAKRTSKGEPTVAAVKVAAVLELRAGFSALVDAGAAPGELRKAVERAWDILLLPGVRRRKASPEPAALMLDLYERHLEEGLSGSEAVDALQLVADPKGVDDESAPVQLMTIHAAKGQEFDCVCVVGEHGPVGDVDDSDLEEERRIFYVAATRARRALTVFSPNKVQLYGKTHEALGRSQWVSETVRDGGMRAVRAGSYAEYEQGRSGPGQRAGRA